MPTDFLTADDLTARGLDPADVPAAFPWAATYTALDGRPCWAADDLTDLTGDDA